jgi:hypothetical protein
MRRRPSSAASGVGRDRGTIPAEPSAVGFVRDPPLRVWLDDVHRPPGSDWTWVKTVEEAIDCLKRNVVAEISLDNDLHPFERDGLEVLSWIHEKNV